MYYVLCTYVLVHSTLCSCKYGWRNSSKVCTRHELRHLSAYLYMYICTYTTDSEPTQSQPRVDSLQVSLFCFSTLFFLYDGGWKALSHISYICTRTHTLATALLSLVPALRGKLKKKKKKKTLRMRVRWRVDPRRSTKYEGATSDS